MVEAKLLPLNHCQTDTLLKHYNINVEFTLLNGWSWAFTIDSMSDWHVTKTFNVNVELALLNGWGSAFIIESTSDWHVAKTL